jgi:trimeric autotransporter adhesin
MKKKLSLIMSLIFTLTIILNIGIVNSFGVTKNVKKTVSKKVVNKKKAPTTKNTIVTKKPSTKGKTIVSSKKTPPVIVKKPITPQTVTVDDAILGAVSWLKKGITSGGDYKINDWNVLALSLAGEDINTDTYKKSGKGYIDFKKETINSETTTSTAITVYAKNIMGLMAAGYDPSYFEGHDLLQELTKRVEVGDDSLTGEAWGMIALSSAGADYNKTVPVKYIETKQNSDGGYGWIPSAPSDVDTTAMVIYALDMSVQNRSGDKSINKALEFLKHSLKDMEKDKTKETVESLSQILMALRASSEDLNSYKINGNSLELEIIKFRNSDGGFKHDIKGTSNEISTYQTLIALEFYKQYKNLYTTLASYEKNALPKVSANIRIEGIDKTIVSNNYKLNNRIVNDYNGKAYDSKIISAYAFLMKALKDNNISSVADYSYGAPYVSTINNIKGGKFGGWDGWMFLVNGMDPGKAMTDVDIKEGDNIVVYYGDYGIAPILLDIKTKIDQASNIYLEIAATVSGKPTQGITINIDGKNVGVTGDNGILNYKIDKSQEITIFAENNDKDGKPLNIRSEATSLNIVVNK